MSNTVQTKTKCPFCSSDKRFNKNALSDCIDCDDTGMILNTDLIEMGLSRFVVEKKDSDKKDKN